MFPKVSGNVTDPLNPLFLTWIQLSSNAKCASSVIPQSIEIQTPPRGGDQAAAAGACGGRRQRVREPFTSNPIQFHEPNQEGKLWIERPMDTLIQARDTGSERHLRYTSYRIKRIRICSPQPEIPNTARISTRACPDGLPPYNLVKNTTCKRNDACKSGIDSQSVC